MSPPTERSPAPKATAAPAKRRRRDPQATREAILDAAEELFIANGPGKTPTSLVARQAGVTKSLIHHHFGSKEELWQEAKRRHFIKYYEVQKAMLTSSPGTAQLVHDSMLAYFRFLASDPEHVRFMARRFVETDDPCLDLEEELFELGQERIREAQAAGELRSDIEPISIIKLILGMPFYWFQSKPFLCQMLGNDDVEHLDESYLQDCLKIFLDGLTKPRDTAKT